jgi:rod shape-determining protein MreD
LRALILSLMVLLMAILQGSLIGPFGWDARPNLPLLMAICGAWMTNATVGSWLGFWSGLLMASLTGMFVGSYAFSYLCVGWLAGRVKEEVYGEWPTLSILAAGLGTLLAEFIFFLWNPRHVWNPLYSLEQAGWNAALAPFLYLLVAWPLRRWDDRRR